MADERKRMDVLFLDIDGVLNGHDWHEGAQSNTIRRNCVASLSRVLQETGCKVVLSSAWRYMVHGKAMTVGGFEYLLRTHGACGIAGKIVGVTCKDEDCCHCGRRHRKGRGKWSEAGHFVCARCGKQSTRGDQIRSWRYSQALVPLDTERILPGAAVALDDEDYGITEAGITLVQTDGRCGMTEVDADAAIRCFRQGKSPGDVYRPGAKTEANACEARHNRERRQG